MAAVKNWRALDASTKLKGHREIVMEAVVERVARAVRLDRAQGDREIVMEAVKERPATMPWPR